jgi:hypothetical protein
MCVFNMLAVKCGLSKQRFAIETKKIHGKKEYKGKDYSMMKC